MPHSQAGASNALGDPGGSADDPGGNDTDDVGSVPSGFSNLATSTTTPERSLRRLSPLL